MSKLYSVQPAPHLEHDGEDGEDDDLDGRPASVPVGSTDTVLQQQYETIILQISVKYDVMSPCWPQWRTAAGWQTRSTATRWW